ncbi:MAG TPA: hypothetical protein PKG98_05725 [Myxococcota bacterium]|nr:hypothetical protein [Myxococcota bacterium]
MTRRLRFVESMICVVLCAGYVSCGNDEVRPDNGFVWPDNGIIQYDANAGDTITGADVPRDLFGVDTAGMDIVQNTDTVTHQDVALPYDLNHGDGGYSDLAAFDIQRKDTTWYDLGPKDNGPLPDYGQCANPGSCEPCGYGAITGMTCAPNMQEVTAMPYVHVWVDTVDCDGNPVLIEDYSDYAGYYRLDNVPCGTQTIYMEKGNFKASKNIWIDKCVVNDYTSSDLCFPGQPARIAVVTGSWDQIEKLLIKLWFKHHQFDGLTEDGQTPSSQGSLLLRGQSAKTNTGKGPYKLVDDYDILFLNCGNATDLIMNSYGSEVTPVLRAFVEKGGSIYASDYALVYLYMAFPEVLGTLSFPRDFAGSATTTPRTVTAELIDENLSAYMRKPTADVEYRLGPLTSVVGTVPQGVQVHVRGPNSSHGNAVEPFMLSFEPFGSKGGRVVFTNFHNDEQLTTGDMTEVLQYVVFMM